MANNGNGSSSEKRGISTLARELKSINTDLDYYALTLTADQWGKVSWSAQTHWIGWSSRREGWEIREASLVHPEKMANLWESVGQDWVCVSRPEHLAAFIRLGGNSLVEKRIADRHLEKVVAPSECVHDGSIQADRTGKIHSYGVGYLPTGHLPDDAATRRAPTRKMRMRVLKRDNYRCVMCGRSPRTNVDIELELHHVIPWRMTGPTEEDNLATLCGTCHDGLEPDYDPKIRDLANLPYPSDPLDMDGKEFRSGVKRYRQLVGRLLEERKQ